MYRFNVLLFFILSSLSLSINAQDAYHQDLEAFLLEEYNVENGAYLFYDNEIDNANNYFTYGSMSVQTETAVGEAFGSYINYTVSNPGNNAWDAGANTRNTSAVSKGDVILISFWAKRLSGTSELIAFSEDGNDFSKEYYFEIVLSNNWQRYFISFEASKDYATNNLANGFHMASIAQEFQIGGYTAYNFGTQYAPGDLPGDVSNVTYEGADPDAPWRALAQARIENIRKADLEIKVVDENNNVIEGADVSIEMQSHEFGFGTAVVSCRFPGNDCFNQIYVSKLVDLDGEGHGFNVAVSENFLKWDGWEEQWIGTPDQAASAVVWMEERGIDMRGHTLVWPGWGNLPDDMQQNATNYEYMLNRLEDRIEEMLTHPVLSEYITEWDVLNEITTNRDLEYSFDNYAPYSNGRELYQTIFNKFEELQPDFKGYVNDYIVLSGGGFGNTVENRYKSFLNELRDSGVKWDGIGFQCHIGSQPTSILKIQQVFDEFFQLYGKRIKITEFDIDPTLSPELQAQYLDDFLTMIYSHPAVDAFLMWGFWDGNHWKGNAPMFDIDWNLKPSGQTFIDKVFNEWWTEASKISDVNGLANFNGFKGTYEITITKDGKSQVYDYTFTGDDSIELLFNGLSNIDNIKKDVFEISPNPSYRGNIAINAFEEVHIESIQVYQNSGKLLKTFHAPNQPQNIQLNLQAGAYILKIFDGADYHIEKLIVTE